MADPTAVIQPKNSLLREHQKNDIILKIATRIQAIPGFQLLKNDLELLGMCCNIVEYLIDNEKMKQKSGKKFDKKEIVIKAFEKAYGTLVEQEKTNIDRNIEYLHENGHIKRPTLYKVFKHTISDWISRRIA